MCVCVCMCVFECGRVITMCNDAISSYKIDVSLGGARHYHVFVQDRCLHVFVQDRWRVITMCSYKIHVFKEKSRSIRVSSTKSLSCAIFVVATVGPCMCVQWVCMCVYVCVCVCMCV